MNEIDVADVLAAILEKFGPFVFEDSEFRALLSVDYPREIFFENTGVSGEVRVVIERGE